VFEGFQPAHIQTAGATINLMVGGSGPPVLLLHGYPQSHVIWHRVAPALAQHYTVVAADLRGYGDSSRPEGGNDHAGYAKRAMAQDQVDVMRALGFERFAVVGHDRGGRVGHRMALDHAERVTRLAVLDIVPTHYVFHHVSADLARLYYHWFFLIQPYDLPERLIGADPIFYLHTKLGGWGSGGLRIFAPEALAEYERCFRDPATIHATCEDYRAAASIDLVHDEADLGRQVTCPVLVLWGERGVPHRVHDVLGAWHEYAADVRGHTLPTGHYLAEERPDETAAALLRFLEGN
jgi:haloacetate dehalogenase